MIPLLSPNQRSVAITAGPVALPGILAWPRQPSGMVIFVHGSGSGRLSPRNAAVAQELRAAGLGTLLFDLLTEAEAADRSNVIVRRPSCRAITSRRRCRTSSTNTYGWTEPFPLAARPVGGVPDTYPFGL
jgi:predicted alpha/beta-hydrolase family hydrolase